MISWTTSLLLLCETAEETERTHMEITSAIKSMGGV